MPSWRSGRTAWRVGLGIAALLVLVAVSKPQVLWPLRLIAGIVPRGETDVAVRLVGRWESVDSDRSGDGAAAMSTFQFTPGGLLRSSLAGRSGRNQWQADGAKLTVLPSLDGSLPMLRGTYRPDLPSRLEFDVSFNDDRLTLMPRFDNEVFGTTPQGQPLFGRRGYVFRRSRSGLRVWLEDLVGSPPGN